MAELFCQSVHHFLPDRKIQTIIRWTAMKVFTDIPGSQIRYPNDVGDIVTFSFSAASRFTFVVLNERSQQLSDGSSLAIL